MKNKLVLGVIVLSVVAFVALKRGGHEAKTESADHKLVVDRLWIDHIPKSERDMIDVFVAVTEEPFGVFATTSRWTTKFERFQYEVNGDEIRLLFGQTGEREKVKATASKCSEGGFDLCLKLDGASRGVKKYYSMEEWVIDGTDQMDHLRAKLATMIKTEQ